MLIRRYKPLYNEDVKQLHYAGVTQIDLTHNHPDNPFVDSDMDDIEGFYINNRGEFLIGVEDDEIVAIGGLKRVSDTCGEIKRIRVRRDRQKQGLGQEIMTRLIETAEELGYQELKLDTLENNLPAQRLFEGQGFMETRRGNLGSYHLIYYKKRLTPRE